MDRISLAVSANDEITRRVSEDIGNTFSRQVSLTESMYSNQCGTDQKQNTGIGHIDGLYRYALMLTRNRSEAEDLVQETYLRALGSISKLRADSNLKGWLFTILRNVWLNQLRRIRSRPHLVEVDGFENGADSIVSISRDPYEIYADKIGREQVREAIQQLPTDFREIIILREFEDLSYQEIATLLDCPAGTVMSRLGRARSKLRALLATTLNASRSQERGGSK